MRRLVRSELLDLGRLEPARHAFRPDKLSGMRAAYDDILSDGIKRRHPVPKIIAALLQAEIADKTARSIKYQMASARLPMAKELADFDFTASPINEALIQELVSGLFLEGKRNLVLVGGTVSGKTHLAVTIVRACWSPPSAFARPARGAAIFHLPFFR